MTKEIIRPILATSLIVFLGFQYYSKNYFENKFISELDNLNMNLEYMIGVKAQYDGSVDTKDFPKIISYDNKEYSIEYDKNNIIIKDFNIKTLCNKNFEYHSEGDKNKAIKRYRSIFIDCQTKDAIVILKDGLK